MFHRKNRSVSGKPQNVAPSASAQTAAAQAFLASTRSNANLSASAAATALRTMSPPPVHVGGVQTKRILRRQTSTSPHRGEHGLHRRSSSVSMTDRTFRSPSPSRPASSMGLPTPREAPPVPPVPKNFQTGMQKRPASLQPAARLVSPAPTGNRVTSLDRGPRKQTSLVTDEEYLERSGSRDLVNFSYPSGKNQTSPPTSPLVSQQTSQILKSSLRKPENDIATSLTESAARPVKKRKKRIVNGSAQGSHLAQGGMGHAEDDVAERHDHTLGRSMRDHSPARSQDFDETSSTPKSTAPAKGERLTAKRQQRAAGNLAKQPSIVREDWEGEQDVPDYAEDRMDPGLSPVNSPSGVRSKKQVAVANTSKVVSDTTDLSLPILRPNPKVDTAVSRSSEVPSEASSQNFLEVEQNKDRPIRQPSTSPSRSARFSTHLTEFGGKPRHEPPPRSVSPAKSALKHHSPSPQTSSPVDGSHSNAWKRGSIASSDTSDNISLDGLGPRSRKKAARVSFEVEPEVVGVAADVDSSDTPIFASPQHKESGKKSWFGKTKGGHLESIAANDEMEEVLKPRPVLPSFGSVRRRDGSSEALPIAEDDPPSSSNSSMIMPSPHQDMSVSSDHAIGSIMNQSLSSSRASPSAKPSAKADFDTPNNTRTTTLPVPSIAVLPATPGPDETDDRDEWLVLVPGGFPEVPPVPALPQQASVGNSTVPSQDDAAEPSPTEIAQVKEVPLPQDVIAPTKSLVTAPVLPHETDDDNDSIYSDAAEDASEMGDDPYGSIDAVVESPVMESSAFVSTPPDSPLARKFVDNATAQGQTRDSKALTESPQKKKRRSKQPQIQQEPLENKPELPIPESPARRAARSSAAIPQNVTPKPKQMAKSMRARQEEPSEQPMVRSMRARQEEASAQPTMRKTMKPRQPPAQATTSPSRASVAIAKKTMQSSPPPVARARQDAGTKTQSMIMPKSRRFSNDSDSSSSFKRTRRPKSSGGGFTMRTSMRGDAGAGARMVSPVSRERNPRSLSPQDRRPYSPNVSTMRSTMRDRSDVSSQAPTLRNQPQQKRSSIFSKSKSKPKSGSKPLSSKFGSRFADSDSDEPGSSPRVFRSRFDSSDDEAEVVKFRPVRGIPKRADAGESTDLEDTSDEETRQAKKVRPKPKTTVSNIISSTKATESPLLPSSPIPTSPGTPTLTLPKKKGGMFSRFWGKKSPAPVPAPALDRPQSPIALPSPTEARGKLQRRHLPSSPAPVGVSRPPPQIPPIRVNSDSWSLPKSSTSLKTARPQTADAATSSKTSSPLKKEAPPPLPLPVPTLRQNTDGTIDTLNTLSTLDSVVSHTSSIENMPGNQPAALGNNLNNSNITPTTSTTTRDADSIPTALPEATPVSSPISPTSPNGTKFSTIIDSPGAAAKNTTTPVRPELKASEVSFSKEKKKSRFSKFRKAFSRKESSSGA